jgi:hypothetical protein
LLQQLAIPLDDCHYSHRAIPKKKNFESLTMWRQIAMPTLPTWAGASAFTYSGSVQRGTQILYGRGHRYLVTVSKSDYQALLLHFRGREVPIGTSRTSPPAGSLGEWLQSHVTRTATASYVGPILIEEGFAEHGDGSDIIRFKK